MKHRISCSSFRSPHRLGIFNDVTHLRRSMKQFDINGLLPPRIVSSTMARPAGYCFRRDSRKGKEEGVSPGCCGCIQPARNLKPSRNNFSSFAHITRRNPRHPPREPEERRKDQTQRCNVTLLNPVWNVSLTSTLFLSLSSPVSYRMQERPQHDRIYGIWGGRTCRVARENPMHARIVLCLLKSTRRD